MSKKASYIYDFKDKERSVRLYMTTMFNRTQSMFSYENLPETIPARELERLLQEGGFAVWTKVNGELYCFTGGLDGQSENVYFDKSWATIANAPLNYSDTVYFKGNLKHEPNAVLMRNDSNLEGLWNINSKYATLLTETDLTIYLSDIMSRATAVLVANDDKSMLSSKKYLEELQRGNLGIIAGNLMFDAVQIQPYLTEASNSITNLIELEQYIKAGWFNVLGLNANFNMKREALNTSESALNQDALRPLIDDMLSCRQAALDEINELWGLNITVSLSSSWAIEEIQSDLLTEGQDSDSIPSDDILQDEENIINYEKENEVPVDASEDVVPVGDEESLEEPVEEAEASIDINININTEPEESSEETEEEENEPDKKEDDEDGGDSE